LKFRRTETFLLYDWLIVQAQTSLMLMPLRQWGGPRPTIHFQ